MRGISLAYMGPGSLETNAALFKELQSKYDLQVCELHMEAIQFEAGIWYWDKTSAGVVKDLRQRVARLGVHLPYLDLNPISPNPRSSKYSRAVYQAAIKKAAEWSADYVVFHARGNWGLYPERSRELEEWRQALNVLASTAEKNGLIFCLENADSIRSLREIDQLLKQNDQIKLCLDIGHLFERIEADHIWMKAADRLWDRFLPVSNIWGRGMPYFEHDGISGAVNAFSQRLGVLHLHNHNGRAAHQPILDGKYDLRPAIRALKPLTNIPIILEADYRNHDSAVLYHDLQLLEEFI